MNLDGESRLRESVPWAVRFFAVEAFITTSAGIISLSPSSGVHPFVMASWWGVAVMMAGGLCTGIAGLALRLYRQFTIQAFFALLVLASIATVFSSSFFNGMYEAHVAETTKAGRDSEQREAEYDRLIQETAALVVNISRTLEDAQLKAEQGEQEALAQARFEREEKTPLNLRGPGPIYEGHLRTAARFRAEMGKIASSKELLKQTPTAPASQSWDDLTHFHTQVVGMLRTAPMNGNLDLTLPTAPKQPAVLTKGGYAQGAGGLVAMTELFLDRDFRNPSLALPLGLGAFCEFAVIILILGSRPWKPFRVWFLEKLENIEGLIDLMPAILPLLWHTLKRGFARDDPKLRQQRYDRVIRWKAVEDTYQEIADIKQQEAELQQQYRNLNGAGRVNSHDRSQANSEHQ